MTTHQNYSVGPEDQEMSATIVTNDNESMVWAEEPSTSYGSTQMQGFNEIQFDATPNVQYSLVPGAAIIDGSVVDMPVAVMPQDMNGQFRTMDLGNGEVQLEEEYVYNFMEPVEYEEITCAYCLECDLLVDTKKDKHSIANCVLRKDYKCHVCNTEFNYEQNYHVHQIVEHSDLSNYVSGTVCNFCDSKRKTKSFQRYHAYMAHLKSHYKSDRFPCNMCEADFEYHALLLRHRRTVHDRHVLNVPMAHFSNELGYCPRCECIIPVEGCEMHKLLHTLHMKIDRNKKKPPVYRRLLNSAARKSQTASTGNNESSGLLQLQAPIEVSTTHFGESTPLTECPSVILAEEEVIPTPSKPIEAEPEEEETTVLTARTGKRTHVCGHCQKAFVRPAELKRHLTTHKKGEIVFVCGICGEKYANNHSLVAHKKIVHSTKVEMFPCKLCGKEFNKRSNLNRHIKSVHPLETRKVMLDCPSCNCSFSSVSQLTRHRREAHPEIPGEGPWECEVCKMCFTRRSTLQRHRLIHSTAEPEIAKPYVCNRCDKRFRLRSTLKMHMDVHARKDIDDPELTDPKCHICMKKLSSRNALRKHMLTHQTKYECYNCYQKFGTLHRLDKHRCVPSAAVNTTQHLTELSSVPGGVATGSRSSGMAALPPKAYQCRHCLTSFYSFKAYRDHSLLHQGLKPHLCWTCHKSFRTADLLALHREIHNREPIYCELCPKIVNSRVQYSQHIRQAHPTDSTVVIAEPVGKALVEPDRELGIVSAQSFPELTGRELAEGLFRGRAQSVDVDRPEMESENYAAEYHIPPPQQHKDQPMRCSVCLHLYKSITHLFQHWTAIGHESAHAQSLIKCPICDVTFSGVTAATQHQLVAHPYLATSKGYTAKPPFFADPNSKILYLPGTAVVHKDKKHQCEQCEMAFVKQSDLLRHIRTHTGERPYPCPICSRSFRVRSSLTAHEKTHRSEQPLFNCLICTKKYYTRNALTLHLRNHTGDKPLKCRHCDETFKHSNSRQAHESAEHDMDSAHKCTKRNCKRCLSQRVKRLAKMQVMEECLNMDGFNAAPADSSLFTRDDATSSSNVAPMANTFERAPPVRNSNLFPVKCNKVTLIKPTVTQPQLERTRCNTDQLIESLRQISAPQGGEPIKQSSQSAFAPMQQASRELNPIPESAHVPHNIYIVAKRITATEYKVVISRRPHRKSRAGIDTNVQIEEDVLTTAASQRSLVRFTLMDQQQLSMEPVFVLKALNELDPYSITALQANPRQPCSVELMPPPNFARRCEPCDRDFHTKEDSDAHFQSEDHECAMHLHPVDTQEMEAIDHLMIPAAIPQTRNDTQRDFTCKLCGRKYPDMDRLVLHIRRDHERDHTQPRPAARTAPIR